MHIEIEDKKYYFYSDFPESISKLKRTKEVDLELIYFKSSTFTTFRLKQQPTTEPIVEEQIDGDLDYLLKLDKLPEYVYITNNYYFWILKNCQIKSKIVNRRDNSFAGHDRVVVKLKLGFDEAWGTNKRSVFERDIKLQELLK
jgi:hypothetical protein